MRLEGYSSLEKLSSVGMEGIGRRKGPFTKGIKEATEVRSSSEPTFGIIPDMENISLVKIEPLKVLISERAAAETPACWGCRIVGGRVVAV
jgi:hypothetical protein